MINIKIIITDLIALLGAERVLTAPEDLIPYSFDGTAAQKQRPRCVVFPKTPEEIAAVLRIAKAKNLPVVTRGSGTGLSGGSLPVPDCIALCLVQMDRVLKLDEKNLTILVEAGVVPEDCRARGRRRAALSADLGHRDLYKKFRVIKVCLWRPL